MQTTRTAVLMSLLACGLAAASAPVHAAATQIFSSSDLSTSDIITNYPATPVTSPIPAGSPFQVPTTGNLLTFTDNGGFQVDSAALNVGFDNTLGEFTSSPLLLDNAVVDPVSGAVSYNGPITINFATPVSEFGVQAFSEDNAQNFNFSVMDGGMTPDLFQVYNDPTAISATNSYAATDFTPAFLGARTAGNDITSVTITDANADPQNGFVLGPLASTAVPEPSPVALLAVGLGLLPLAVRRRRSA